MTKLTYTSLRKWVHLKLNKTKWEKLNKEDENKERTKARDRKRALKLLKDQNTIQPAKLKDEPPIKAPQVMIKVIRPQEKTLNSIL